MAQEDKLWPPARLFHITALIPVPYCSVLGPTSCNVFGKATGVGITA